MPKPRPAAVIFDCDGVLVDSEALGQAVLVELANAQGRAFSLADVREAFTGQSMAFVRAWFEERLARALPGDFEEAYRRRSAVRFRENLRPVAGVRTLLGGLDLPRCVASNGPRDKMRPNLVTTDLLRYFVAGGREWLFSAYDVGRWKPDPGLFLHAAEAMGVAPGECLVVEDSIPGVEAALAGGFRVVAYAGGHAARAGIFQGLGVPVARGMREVGAALTPRARRGSARRPPPRP